jgi:hypothetical protein
VEACAPIIPSVSAWSEFAVSPGAHGQSAVSNLFDFRSVTVAHDLDLGRSTVEFSEIVAGELDGGSARSDHRGRIMDER